jgi:hypothetical protein
MYVVQLSRVKLFFCCATVHNFELHTCHRVFSVEISLSKTKKMCRRTFLCMRT